MAGKKSTDSETAKAMTIDQLQSSLIDTFGDEAALAYKDRKRSQRHRLLSGSIVIDTLTGGGILHGSRVEVTGGYSAGKSFFLYNMAESILLNDPKIDIVVIIDSELVADNPHPTLERLDNLPPELSKKLMYLRGGDAISIYDQVVYIGKSKLNSVFMIDSLSTLKLRKFNVEASKDKQKHVGDMQVGIDAKMVSELLTQYIAATTPTPSQSPWSTLIAVNHKYTDIGKGIGTWTPEVEKGGNALKYLKNIQLDFKRLKRLDADGKELSNSAKEEQAGLHTNIRTLKNQTFPEYLDYDTAFFTRENNIGVPAGTFDHAYELRNIGLSCGAITASSSYYSYQDIKYQMKDWRKFRVDDPEKFYKIVDEVKKQAISYWRGYKENDIQQEVKEDKKSKKKEEAEK